MLLEKQDNTRNEDIVWLTNDYIKAVYSQKWNINCSEAILIKNKIVVLLGKIYKDIVDSFFAWNINKEKIFEFISAVNNLMWAWIINAKNDIFYQLLEKNQGLANDEKQLKIVRDYINKEIDKNLAWARVEIDSVVDTFRQRCIEILLEKGQNVVSMLKMSHDRNKIKIWELKQENLWLKSQVWDLEQTVDKQAKTIKRWFKEWRELNTRVWELEVERSNILSFISQIEKELEWKKRKLKWDTLSEKLNWFLSFTREIQYQETYWQKSFVIQQNFDRTEIALRNEITDLSISLQNAQKIAMEINDELVLEQRKNHVLTTNDELVIKENINKQITDYFCFLLDRNDFVNQTKQEELELTIKMTYYKAKALNIDIYDFANTHIEKIKELYKKSFGDVLKKEQLENAINDLKIFINMLQYWNNYVNNAIGIYSKNLDL